MGQNGSRQLRADQCVAYRVSDMSPFRAWGDAQVQHALAEVRALPCSVRLRDSAWVYVRAEDRALADVTPFLREVPVVRPRTGDVVRRVTDGAVAVVRRAAGAGGVFVVELVSSDGEEGRAAVEESRQQMCSGEDTRRVSINGMTVGTMRNKWNWAAAGAGPGPYEMSEASLWLPFEFECGKVSLDTLPLEVLHTIQQHLPPRIRTALAPVLGPRWASAHALMDLPSSPFQPTCDTMCYFIAIPPSPGERADVWHKKRLQDLVSSDVLMPSQFAGLRHIHVAWGRSCVHVRAAWEHRSYFDKRMRRDFYCAIPLKVLCTSRQVRIQWGGATTYSGTAVVNCEYALQLK
eukprot:TRINITY_DN9635_c0_g1_i1.p1 TRINITY_DN9635_c0_g1~~TRINITY_DN9635_c0_g1_i1.p1  ORF type:complete len:348 (+),score=67.59 TRINITY_DN9635_c0_g1_i1:223-1266(+)